MPKNIVLLSDGTGNTSATLFTTNVWRLYEALDLSDPDRQVAYYDDGVGTSSFKPLAILGGVFGFGLKRNVIDLYSFLCRNYRQGATPEACDRIFGFGFSRGSFTIRVVAGLVAHEGLARYDGNAAQLTRDAKDAYRAYRRRFKTTLRLETPLRWSRDQFIRLWRCLWRIRQYDAARQLDPHAIHFLGLWDTVNAYGGPIEEITRGIDYWVWPLSMPDRFMSHRIKRACHALALDDERHAFWPVLWDERFVKDANNHPQGMNDHWTPIDRPNLPDIDQQRLSQVWFTGMHSDVGGGYSQDGLAYVTLDWMMDRAEVYSLRLKGAERTRLSQLANTFDKLNDSRHGLGGYYRYKPRKLTDLYAADPHKPTLLSDIAQGARNITQGDGREIHLRGDERPCPTLHESVFQRIKAGADGYSPIVLPETYRVTTKAGDIRSAVYEHQTQATMRTHRQEQAWNWVWGRRVVYFATVFASLFLAALPLIETWRPGRGAASPIEFLIPLIAAAGSVLPALAKPWIDAFKAAPEYAAAGGVLVAVLLYVGGVLRQTIFDKMRTIWLPILAAGPCDVGPSPQPDDLLYRVRTSKLYRSLFYALTHWVLPTICALLIYIFLLYGAVVVTSRVFFPSAAALASVCKASERTQEVAGKAGPVNFKTRALCQATGLTVAQGMTYRITLKITDPWEDGHKFEEPQAKGIATGPNGFGWDRMTWTMIGGIPLRRFLSGNWFQTIVRIGATGFDERPLTFKPVEEACACPKPEPTTFASTFKARSTGEVFLFVNDSVLGLPWIADIFYRKNNKGAAEVIIEPAPQQSS